MMEGIVVKQTRQGQQRLPRQFRQNNWITRWEALLLPIMILILILGLWELTSRAGWVKPILISSPSLVMQKAVELIASGELWIDLAVSGKEFGWGFLIALAVGIPLGIAVGWYPKLFLMTDGFISLAYATPRIAFVPIIIMWLGIGIWSKVAIILLEAVFPVLINTMAGVRTLDANVLRVARSFSATNFQIFAGIALPSSVPFIVSGIRMALGRALVGILVGEMFASFNGLGNMIFTAGATMQTDTIWVGVSIFMLAGLLFSEGIKLVEKRLEAWKPRSG